MQATPESTASIPIIDFARFEHEPEACALEIREACELIGFFYLRNHGIPEGSIERMFNKSKEYFGRPLEEKSKFAITEKNVGYSTIRQEILDPTHQEAGDFKESFNFGKFVNGKGTHAVPDIFDEAELARFAHECHALCMRILRAFAIALQIPESEGGANWFASRHAYDDCDSGDILRILHYPSMALVGDDDVRAGSHSDYGSLTLLFQKDVGGLEVQLEGGRWIPVPVMPGCVLVNIGDLLEFWSVGLFRSTKHRVVFYRDTASIDRYSMTYFCHAVNAAPLVPIPADLVRARLKSRSAEAAEANDPPMTAGEHLRRRLDATYMFY